MTLVDHFAASRYYKQDIRWLAAAISILLSLLVMSHHQPINPDGILYIHAAQAYLAGGIHAAMQIYPRPFLSILMATLSQVAHLPLLVSGLIISSAFMVLLVVSFISLIKTLGGDHRLQWLAALVILINHHLNVYRDNVMRDYGYYALAILAMIFLIRFLRDYRWRDAIAWTLIILLATLFRIEGIAFAFAGPAILLLKPKLSFIKKIGYCLRGYTLLIIIALLLGGYILMHHVQVINTHTSFTQMSVQLLHGFALSSQKFHTLSNLIDTQIHVISPLEHGKAPTLLLSGIVGIFVATVISTLGIVYSILAAYAFFNQKVKTDWSGFAILFGFMIINVVVLFVWLSQQYYLPTRHVEYLSLILAAAVPYAIAAFYDNWKTRARTLTGKLWVFPLMCVGLVYVTIAGIGHFGTSKTYLLTSANWLYKHVPIHHTIYTNNEQLAFYATNPYGTRARHFNIILSGESSLDLLKQKQWHQQDYLALTFKRHKPIPVKLAESTLGFTVQKIFSNHKGDRVVIFYHSPSHDVSK